jgi:hypothetical protein
MKRELQSVTIRYYTKNVDEQIVPDQSVVVTYRLLDDQNNLLAGDTIVIYPSTNYSIYEEKIQKICQIAFEE